MQTADNIPKKCCNELDTLAHTSPLLPHRLAWLMLPCLPHTQEKVSSMTIDEYLEEFPEAAKKIDAESVQHSLMP